MADQVARGDSYDLPAIMTMSRHFDALASQTCDTRFMTNAVLLESKAVDLQIATADLDAVDTALARVGRLSARLLHCAPMASLGWLGLYWSRSVRDGFSEASLSLLRNSYETGRHEGWIDFRRNPLALAVFEALPPDLQDNALDEFVDLIRLAQLDQATARFLRLESPIQHRILSRIDDVPDNIRSGLFKKLRRLGFDDLSGVEVSRPYVH